MLHHSQYSHRPAQPAVARGWVMGCGSSRSVRKWQDLELVPVAPRLKFYLCKADATSSYTAWTSWFSNEIRICRGVLEGGVEACVVNVMESDAAEGGPKYRVNGRHNGGVASDDELVDGVRKLGTFGLEMSSGNVWFDDTGGFNRVPTYTAETLRAGADGWQMHVVRSAKGEAVAKALSKGRVDGSLSLKCSKNVDVGVVVALVCKAVTVAGEKGRHSSRARTSDLEAGSAKAGGGAPLKQGAARQLIHKFEESSPRTPASVLVQVTQAQSPGRASPKPRPSFDVATSINAPNSSRDRAPSHFESPGAEQFHRRFEAFEARPDEQPRRLTPGGSLSAGSAKSLLLNNK